MKKLKTEMMTLAIHEKLVVEFENLLDFNNFKQLLGMNDNSSSVISSFDEVFTCYRIKMKSDDTYEFIGRHDKEYYEKGGYKIFKTSEVFKEESKKEETNMKNISVVEKFKALSTFKKIMVVGVVLFSIKKIKKDLNIHDIINKFSK